MRERERKGERKKGERERRDLKPNAQSGETEDLATDESTFFLLCPLAFCLVCRQAARPVDRNARLTTCPIINVRSNLFPRV